jgi:hypothetical protein
MAWMHPAPSVTHVAVLMAARASSFLFFIVRLAPTRVRGFDEEQLCGRGVVRQGAGFSGPFRRGSTAGVNAE